jgi:hypothetical protein
VHEGVVPNIHAPLALGCAVEWRRRSTAMPPCSTLGRDLSARRLRRGRRRRHRRRQGGRAARASGCARGRRLAFAPRQGCRRQRSRPLAPQLARELALRPFLDALYAPRPQLFAPPDETIICRCEEVTAGALRARAAIGRPGLNQIKAFTRAGHGAVPGPAMRLYGHASDRRGAATSRLGDRLLSDQAAAEAGDAGELASLDEREPAA